MRAIAVSALIVLAACPAYADHKGHGSRLWPHCWTRHCPDLGCAPDDYCRKPICIQDYRYCGGCDDYCRKLICVPDYRYCGGVDDYCRKCQPTLVCPPWSPYLYYGSGKACVLPGNCR